MARRLTSFFACVMAVAQSTPALAMDATSLPEPGGVTLLALGLAGVLIGRRMAQKD